jgi:aldose 1-epimerase
VARRSRRPVDTLRSHLAEAVLGTGSTWEERRPMPVSAESFGHTPDGEAVDRFTLSAGAARVGVLSYGGAICSIEVPDRRGESANVALGLTNLTDYIEHTFYFGCIAGRYANRIAAGRFTLDGRAYQIPLNDGPNALHGGGIGLDKRVWRAEPAGDAAVRLRYTSPDGDQGFPGTVEMSVTYALVRTPAGDAELTIDYTAVTDAPTVINLTNHTYVNLAGEGSGDIYDHLVRINADWYTPVRPDMIPTGTIEPVAGTPLDFTRPTAVGARIRDSFPQLVLGQGYDHNYVLNRAGEPGLVPAAEAYEPVSGRVLRVLTTEPGVQFYSGNHLDGSVAGPAGRTYRQGDGLALETQHFPDSPNHPQFPSTVLRPGQVYRTTTVFEFSVRDEPAGEE